MPTDQSLTASSLLGGYLTRRELAKELRKHERTLYRWEKLRCGPPITFMGEEKLYSKQSVLEWLKANEK